MCVYSSRIVYESEKDRWNLPLKKEKKSINDIEKLYGVNLEYPAMQIETEMGIPSSSAHSNIGRLWMM